MSVVRLYLVMNVTVALAFLATLLFVPVPLDMLFIADTAFLANLGWRGVNGLSPVIDYPHFYGGMTAKFVTWAFHLFGVSYKSIHYAFAMMFGAASVVLLLLTWKRLPAQAISLLLALSSMIVLSLAPIELTVFPWLRSTTHSWVYNHVGIVLMMALIVFALKDVESRAFEYTAAFVAGVALSGLILLKTTFGVILPCVALACAIQRRWYSAAAVLLGAGAAISVMDPGLDRSLGSLQFLLSTSAVKESTSLIDRAMFAARMINAQAGPIAVGIVMGATILCMQGRAALPFLISALICGGGFGLAMLSTGGRPDLLLVPFLVVFLLLAADRLTAAPTPNHWPDDRRKHSSETMLAWALPACMAYALLILPGLVAAGYAGLRSFQYTGTSLVEEGPFATYFAFGRATRIPGMEASDVAARRAAANAEVFRLVEEGISVSLYDHASVDYVVYADGVALLQKVPNVRTYGIVATSYFDFTMPLGSKVVPSFPVWPAPDSIGDSVLGPEVDLVMTTAIDAPYQAHWDASNAELQDLLGEAFVLCRRSAFWQLHARRGSPDGLCAEGLEGRS